MLLQALLRAVPVRGELDRAALAAHAAMLGHGFVCVGSTEPAGEEAAIPDVFAAEDGSVSLRVVPPGWNAALDSFSFCYVHPLRGPAETFTMKALGVGDSLAVHAASSLPGADLLTVALKVDQGAAEGDQAAVAARAQDWEEKTTVGIAVRLLARHNSTSRLAKALDASEPAVANNDRTAAGGMKRPAPEDERPRPDRQMLPVPDRPAFPPFSGPDPFSFPHGGFDDSRPLLWTPDGNLLGPRHPAWGQGVPVGPRGGFGGNGGWLPRFDPILPGTGEPDPDHLRVPGMHRDFPGFQGGATGGRRMDPDGMFIM